MRQDSHLPLTVGPGGEGVGARLPALRPRPCSTFELGTRSWEGRRWVALPSLCLAPPHGGQSAATVGKLEPRGRAPPAMQRASQTPMLGFPDSSVVRSLPAIAGDTGLIPGLGRSHMPRSS